MSSFEIGANRPVGAIQSGTAGAVSGVAANSPATSAKGTQDTGAAAQVATSDAVKAGEAPVDSERVATIRKAIEEGKYPVIPAKIADAMIAAGMLLRKVD